MTSTRYGVASGRSCRSTTRGGFTGPPARPAPPRRLTKRAFHDHRGGEARDAAPLDGHDVALAELLAARHPHARRSSRSDDVAWIERDQRADRGDDLRQPDEHLRCRAVLLELSIDPATNPELLGIVDEPCRGHARAHRAERIHALGGEPVE